MRGIHRFSTWYFTAALFIAGVSAFLGQFEFGGYDASMLVDTGWRTFLHQKPYRDFPSLLPPLFLYSADASMHLFGGHWYALTLGQSCFFLLIALCGWLLVRFSPKRPLPALGSGMLACFLLAIALPQIITLHLWHAVDASMLATCLLLGYLLHALPESLSTEDNPAVKLWGVPLLRRLGEMPASPSRLRFNLLMVSVSAALWLSKPNLAIVAQASVLLFALFSKRRLFELGFWFQNVVAGGVLAGALLVCLGVNPGTVIKSYTQISDRPKPVVLLQSYFSVDAPASAHMDAILLYVFVLCILPLAICYLAQYRRCGIVRAAVPLLLCGEFLTLAGFMTNWDIRSNDIAPIFFSVAFSILGVAPKISPVQRQVRGVIAVLLAEVVVLVGFGALHRTRMVAVGPWAGLHYGPRQFRHDHFFGPMVARRDFWQVVDTIDQYRKLYPDGKVFFGPRLEFEYARCAIPSPKQLPIWWHPGSSYPATLDVVAPWIASHFDTIYLFDVTRMPEQIVDQLAGYDLVTPPGSIIRVYRRRTAPGS